MKLKICGMKDQDNITEVAAMQPDYLGFIFYENSPRNFDTTIPEVSENIKKIGVFVNAKLNFIVDKIEKYNLQGVQLHGNESPEFCKQLRHHYEEQNDAIIASNETDSLGFSYKSRNDKSIIIIKVFSIKNQFDFSLLEPYDKACDYYLFDTKGKEPGGNGYTFNWNVLKQYKSNKSYFLSGGIGPDEIDSLLLFLKRPESDLCCTLDLNSKFEISPGIKNIKKLKEFQFQLIQNGYGV
jgi:phosphoribosylanthranilate isomerase